MLGGRESQRGSKAGNVECRNRNRKKKKKDASDVLGGVDFLVGKKEAVGAFEHPPREVTHDRLCLCREAPKHDVVSAIVPEDGWHRCRHGHRAAPWHRQHVGSGH
jgi:hypothetical protein